MYKNLDSPELLRYSWPASQPGRRAGSPPPSPLLSKQKILLLFFCVCQKLPPTWSFINIDRTPCVKVGKNVKDEVIAQGNRHSVQM